MNWWSQNQLRLIQNNLRETDATLDVDLLIHELQQLNTNVLMMNAGGIVAFYPSTLEYQYISSSLHKDLLGEAVHKAHAAGIKFIARFDFSKAHESIYALRPEWFYRSKSGEVVNYHGIVHTCLNSYYQQEYSLLMIDEVLSKYPIDGVFFNMFGYQTKDYSGKDYGLCYCDNCRHRFQEMYALTLPEQATSTDPNYEDYRRFQEITTRDMLDRIHSFVKSRNPNVAISTYHHHKVDIIRKESNTALSRPHPVWLYSASENVMSVENSWDDKLVSNCSINAIDLQYRFTGVSKYESLIRLYENIAAGSGLDFCIIGQFEDYTDRGNLSSVKEVFQFHRDHEQYFGNLQPISDVLLLKPNRLNSSAQQEYLGIFKMLKEQHVMFEVMEQDAFHHASVRQAIHQRFSPNGIKAIIIPGLAKLESEQIDQFTQLRKLGVHIIATGRALRADAQALHTLFGVKLDGSLEETDASYVQINDRSLFPSFSNRDWLIVGGTFGYTSCEPNQKNSCQTYLPLVAPSTFGPPERAYGHQLTNYAGLTAMDHKDDGALSFYYPWNIGELYYKHGYEDHKLVLTDVLDHIFSVNNQIRLSLVTNAPPSVEIFLHELPDHSIILQLINLSGFNGVTYHAPLPIRDIQLKLCRLGDGRKLGEAKLLHAGTTTTVHSSENGDYSLTLDVLEQYEAIVIKRGTT